MKTNGRDATFEALAWVQPQKVALRVAAAPPADHRLVRFPWVSLLLTRLKGIRFPSAE